MSETLPPEVVKHLREAADAADAFVRKVSAFEVERVLRALDERCREYERSLREGADDFRSCGRGAAPEVTRLEAKARGVAVARSYIATALRGVR